jgi:hypothetical protein
MLRDPSLIPLSRQHHRALALCVRIDRSLKSGATDLELWQPEIDEQFRQEIRFHFGAEEAVLFPAAESYSVLAGLVGELRAEHNELRRHFALASARAMSASDLREFADLLSTHIRKKNEISSKSCKPSDPGRSAIVGDPAGIDLAGSIASLCSTVSAR